MYRHSLCSEWFKQSLAVCCALLCSALAVAAEPVAMIAARTGDVSVLRAGASSFQAITVNTELYAGDTLATGTVGLAHGWGDPDDKRPTREKGSNVQLLIPRDVGFDKVTGLAQQSAFPVNIYPNR